LVPRKPGQSYEDRGLDMENALNFLSSNGLDVDGEDGKLSERNVY
jgi:hypothetical protein